MATKYTDEQVDAKVKQCTEELNRWKEEKRKRTAARKAEEERRRMQADVEFASEWRPVVEWMKTVGKSGRPLSGDGESSLSQCIIEGYQQARGQAGGTPTQPLQ